MYERHQQKFHQQSLQGIAAGIIF